MISSILDQVVKIEFSDTGMIAFPCGCLITRTDGGIHTGVGASNTEALEGALDVLRYALDLPRIGLLLKLCEPLPQVDESALKPRSWQIDSEECQEIE